MEVPRATYLKALSWRVMHPPRGRDNGVLDPWTVCLSARPTYRCPGKKKTDMFYRKIYKLKYTQFSWHMCMYYKVIITYTQYIAVRFFGPFTEKPPRSSEMADRPDGWRQGIRFRVQQPGGESISGSEWHMWCLRRCFLWTLSVVWTQTVWVELMIWLCFEGRKPQLQRASFDTWPPHCWSELEASWFFAVFSLVQTKKRKLEADSVGVYPLQNDGCFRARLGRQQQNQLPKRKSKRRPRSKRSTPVYPKKILGQKLEGFPHVNRSIWRRWWWCTN